MVVKSSVLLQISQHTLLLIDPFVELSDNPSWRHFQLKRLISPTMKYFERMLNIKEVFD